MKKRSIIQQVAAWFRGSAQNVTEHDVINDFFERKKLLDCAVEQQIQKRKELLASNRSLQAIDKINAGIVFKELDVPVFYRETAKSYLQQMLPDERIDVTKIVFKYLKEKAGFYLSVGQLVWVYNGYFVSIGMKPKLGYISNINKTTTDNKNDFCYLTLVSSRKKQELKSVCLHFNRQNGNPTEITYDVFDFDEYDLQSRTMQVYGRKPKEQKLIKDCGHYQNFLL